VRIESRARKSASRNSDTQLLHSIRNFWADVPND
jgi:hypothetical protein